MERSFDVLKFIESILNSLKNMRGPLVNINCELLNAISKSLCDQGFMCSNIDGKIVIIDKEEREEIENSQNKCFFGKVGTLEDLISEIEKEMSELTNFEEELRKLLINYTGGDNIPPNKKIKEMANLLIKSMDT